MKYFVISFFLLCGLCLSALEKYVLGMETQRDSILASVNGESITLQDVILESSAEEARLAAIYTGTELYRKIEEVRRELLEELIQRKLVYAAYLKNPFEIPSQHVEDSIDALAGVIGDGTRASLERRVKSYGSSMEELRQKAREKIATEVLIYRNCFLHVRITPKEIFETYESMPEKWSKPEQIGIQLLQVLKKKDPGNAEPEEIIKNLQIMLENADEDTFTEIVKKNSTGPNAGQGGKMGWIVRDKLRPEFSEVLRTAEEGKIVGPVETPEGYYFIRVTGIIPAEKVPFEKAAPEIERQLREKAVKERKKFYIDQLKEYAVIRMLI